MNRVLAARIVIAGLGAPLFVGALDLLEGGRTIEAAIAASVGLAFVVFAVLARPERLAAIWPTSGKDGNK